jgi:HlyD family secretion protein
MKKEKIAHSDVGQTLGLGRRAGSRRRLGRWLIVILLFGAVAVFAFLQKSEKPDSMQFETQDVRRGDLTVIVTATGTLQPTNEVDVGSELSGIVDSVEADYNDKVKIGQVLARLDTSKLDAQVTQSQAALESAEAQVLQAKATVNETQSKLLQLQKVRELSNSKVPSQLDLDAAQAAFERAKADQAGAIASVSQAQATLATYQTDLSKTVIRSPINGIVLDRSIEPGQTVAAAFQAPVLFTLAEDLTQMELHVDVDEADIGQVKEDQNATFTVDAYPDRIFEARITQTRFGSQTVEGVVTYETVLQVDNSDMALRPGMTATADITVQKVENAILVPNAGLRFVPPTPKEQGSSDGSLVGRLLPRPPGGADSKPVEEININKQKQRVYVLQNGEPVEVSVTVGATDGIDTEILSGDVKETMAVIVDTVSSRK